MESHLTQYHHRIPSILFFLVLWNKSGLIPDIIDQLYHFIFVKASFFFFIIYFLTIWNNNYVPCRTRGIDSKFGWGINLLDHLLHIFGLIQTSSWCTVLDLNIGRFGGFLHLLDFLWNWIPRTHFQIQYIVYIRN